MSTKPITRDLPPEQRKLSDDVGDDEEVSLQTMARAEELARQYEAIKDRTVDDTTILGKLTDIDSSENNARIIVHIDLPGEGHDKQFRFRKPKVWSESYDFVRWIRYYDYDADSFPNMLEDQCKVKITKEDESYDLFIPECDEPIVNLSNTSRWAKSKGLWALKTYARLRTPLSGIAVFGLILHSIAVISDLITYDMTGDALFGWTAISLLVLVAGVIIEWEIMDKIRERDYRW